MRNTHRPKETLKTEYSGIRLLPGARERNASLRIATKTDLLSSITVVVFLILAIIFFPSHETTVAMNLFLENVNLVA